MENSTTWVNNLNLHENSSDLIIFVFADVPSAGYVSIRVSSNNNSTYVGLGTPSISPTNSTDINFPTNYQFRVGFGGTVVFPVSPTSMIQIYVGISFGEATLTVTITYYY